MTSREDDFALCIRNCQQDTTLGGCADDFCVMRHPPARGFELKSNSCCEPESPARICHLTCEPACLRRGHLSFPLCRIIHPPLQSRARGGVHPPRSRSLRTSLQQSASFCNQMLLGS